MTASHVCLPKPPIRVTQTDSNRLRMLANAMAGDNKLADELLGELDRAEIVPDTSKADFIAIGSAAIYDTATQGKRSVELVLPGDADIARGRISILTPVGVALLGLSAGQSIEWQTRDGRNEALTVLCVNNAPLDEPPYDDGPTAA